MTIYDFAIVGAGMAGASLAAELADHASVLVLEAEDRPGYHATGRSAAFWEQCYGGPQLVPLTLASGRYLREHGFLSERGALYIGRAQDRGLIDDFMARFGDSGATIERIDRPAMLAAIPGLRAEWSEAIWQPACADIDVAGLHQHYLATGRARGVAVRTRARIVLSERKDALWTLRSETGDVYHAKTLVNAAGAWADGFAAIAGARPLGITPLRRTVAQLRTDPPPPAVLPLVLDIAGQFYFKPESGRLWLSPHDEVVSPPCDAAPEEIDVALAIDRFQSVTDWRVLAVEHRWAGLRSFAPDRLPVYGFDPVCAGFVWFAGQGGYGIQTAPAAARLCAQLVLGLERDELTRALDAALYDPGRFA